MTCKKCKGQWCWQCRGDWSRHGSHTGGLYRCTLYETSEAKKLDEEAKKEINETNNFIQYLNMYTPFHKAATELAANMFSLIKRLQGKVKEEEHVEVVRKAINVLIQVCFYGFSSSFF
jgi:ariadne-1